MGNEIKLSTFTKDELNECVKLAVADAMQRGEEAKQVDAEKDELLSRKEVMNMLQISSVTLWSRMKDGTIPYKQIGRRVLFSKKEVLEAINTRGAGNGK